MRVQEIIKRWPLEAINKIRPLSGGAINESFRVATARGDWVLRLYKKKPAREIGFELALLSHLGELPVPQVREVKKKKIIRFGGEPAIIYKYIPGKPLFRHTSRERRQVGGFLARLHDKTKNFKWSGKRNALYDLSERKIKMFADAVARMRLPRYNRFLAISRDVRLFRPSAQLPSGAIHVDVKPGNVLFSAAGLSGVIDFDNACLGPYILDLAKSMAWFGQNSGSFNMRRALDVYQGYANVRPLNQLEKRELHNTLKFAFASHIFVDYYMHASGRTPKEYFNFIINDFYGAYQNFLETYDRQQFSNLG